MFYDNKNISYKLLGVFYVERKRRDVEDKNRRHTAISYRIKGGSSFITDNKELKTDDGSVTFIPAGVDYRHKSESEEKLIVVHLEASADSSSGIEILNGKIGLESSFRALLEAWESGKKSSYNRAMSCFYSILERLSEIEEQPPSYSAIDKGVELLHSSFRDPELSISRLAEECSVSEVYFRRIYGERFGVSPLKALLNLRFGYAKRLLSSGYYTISQTAELSGFSDVKYFRTAFKARYGITPTEYVKKAQRTGSFR